MKTKLFTKTAIILAIILGLSTLIPINTVHAEDVCTANVPDTVKQAAGCSGNSDAIRGIITGILNTIILVSGTIAVIYVIIGGINYMTSTGDASKLEKARKTILYAAIGIIICALSFAIVNFVVIRLINNNQSGGDPTVQAPSENTNPGGHPSEI